VDANALKRRRERQCLPGLVVPVYLARMARFPASGDAATSAADGYMVEAGSI
jgi:D-xylose 1-dehydrogenase